jgi:hypothetical protein
MAFQLKIQLKNITKPPVWREIIIPEKYTFHQLHKLIQLVFGWEDSHLYQFSLKGYGSNPTIAIPLKDDWEQPDMNALKTILNNVLTAEKQTFTYIYDFGDDWVHQITVEKILTDEIKKPVCLAGKGACPPEDCGGTWGYENLKIILADPNHEEHLDMKEWLGLEEVGDWDSSYFELDEINQMLKGFK